MIDQSEVKVKIVYNLASLKIDVGGVEQKQGVS